MTESILWHLKQCNLLYTGICEKNAKFVGHWRANVHVSCIWRWLEIKLQLKINWFSIAQYGGNFRGAGNTRVYDLPRVATRQCGDRESNPRPVDCKSSALTTTLPSHTLCFDFASWRPHTSLCILYKPLVSMIMPWRLCPPVDTEAAAIAAIAEKIFRLAAAAEKKNSAKPA